MVDDLARDLAAAGLRGFSPGVLAAAGYLVVPVAFLGRPGRFFAAVFLPVAPGGRPRCGALAPFTRSARCRAQKSLTRFLPLTMNRTVSTAGFPHVSHTSIVFSANVTLQVARPWPVWRMGSREASVASSD